jgi:hypothetical protein
MYCGFYGMGAFGVALNTTLILLGIYLSPFVLFGFLVSWVPFLIMFFVYEDNAYRYHAMRLERNEDRADHKARLARKEETERFDALCKPWNVILRDPDASKEEKDLARTILADLALGHK